MALILKYTHLLLDTFTKTCLVLTLTYTLGILFILAAYRKWSLRDSTSVNMTDNNNTIAETNSNDKKGATTMISSGTSTLTSSQLPTQLDTVYEVTESVTKSGIMHDSNHLGILDDGNILAFSTKPPLPQPSFSTPSPRYTRRPRANTQPFHSSTPPPLTMSPSLSTSTTQSSPALSPSCSSTLHQRRRRDSRVGQLVQQFEMGVDSRYSVSSTCYKEDIANNKVNDTIASLYKIHTANSPSSPIACQSPTSRSSSDTTRTIGHRSIGFHPVFTTWEKRVTEANSLIVPSPSRSTPARLVTRRSSTISH
ncbi:hypothetical protein BC941DRAFT_512567 [Chlamydoabsidia padenii]|nr:hypothetical protein BC941DRAFT_512567 [Chlamydoabsidia padenii]